jgi:hypothetical protein
MKFELQTTDKQFALIGRMVMAWNEAEQVWFLIYTCLVYQLPRTTIEAIFKKNTTGSSQRDLVMAVAETALAAEEFGDILNFIRQAKKETNNLAMERNDIVHGDYHLSLETAPLTFSAMATATFSVTLSSGSDWRKRPNIFAGKNLDEELPPLINDIKALVSQLDQIRQHLLWRYIPDSLRRPTISPNIPAEVRAAMIARDPTLTAPTGPLVWSPIRPNPRSF